MSLKLVADEVGLSQPALYKYFGSLEEILIAACQYWVEEARSLIDSDRDLFLDAEKRLKAVISGNLTYTSKNLDKDALLLNLYYCSTTSTPARELYSEITDGAFNGFIKY